MLAASPPRATTLEAAPLTVAAVQGGGEQGTSALDVPSQQVTEALLAATATIEPDPDLDLVVWPENGIDVDDEPFERQRRVHAAVAAEAAPARRAVLGRRHRGLGVLQSTRSEDAFVNAQVVVTPDGESHEPLREGAHRAVRRVRAVPRAARGARRTARRGAERRRRRRGPGRNRAARRHPAGGDDLVGGVLRRARPGGDDSRGTGDTSILLNPTNGASYTGTVLQTQQVASSKLRAIENGRWVVQVSPTGFSAFVDPDGGVHQRTDVSEQRGDHDGRAAAQRSHLVHDARQLALDRRSRRCWRSRCGTATSNPAASRTMV